MAVEVTRQSYSVHLTDMAPHPLLTYDTVLLQLMGMFGRNSRLQWTMSRQP